MIMDELENESLSLGEDSKKKRKELQRKFAKKGRNKCECAELGEEEDEDAVFIDNLPNDEFEIRKLLKEVMKHAKLLEKQFFEDEDSEREDQLKKITNVAQHEEALQAFKESSYLKQFWCVPLSEDVRTFNWNILIDS